VPVVPIARYFNPTFRVALLGQTVTFENGQGLNMGFQIQRTMTQTPDTCDVTIEGLSPVRTQAMAAIFSATGESAVEIQAGYDRTRAGLFRGDLRNFSGPKRVGPSEIVRLTADDGGNAFTDVIIRRISNAGMTASEMIDTAATAMQIVLGPSVAKVLAASDPGRQGPYTAVFTGRASELLDAACRRIRARWWIRDGQLVLGHRGLPDSSRKAVVVPPGAIVSGPSTQGSGLSEAVVFLDPNIVPGSQVVLGSLRLRVEAVVYSGETRGGIWTAQIVGRKL
jgi:hypothetical protein